MKPKKHLGQHFLADQNIARKICSLLPAAADEPVVEIGPGLGALTKWLLQTHPHLLAVEYDHDAAASLRQTFAGTPLQIIHADILDFQPSQHLQSPAWFIGNLPYNISSQIFFHLIGHRQWVKGGVFMVQKEVADRLASPPGNKEYGILSILLGYYFEIIPGFKVPPTVFIPPPKVQSAVFSIRRRPQEGPALWENLSLVVKKGFNQRRKTLRNALKGLNFTADCEPYFSLRAEQLSIADFEKLAISLLPQE